MSSPAIIGFYVQSPHMEGRHGSQQDVRQPFAVMDILPTSKASGTRTMRRSWGHAPTGFGSARPRSMVRAPSMDLTIIFPWKGRVCIRRPTDLQPFLTIGATKLLAVHGDIFTADRDSAGGDIRTDGASSSSQ